MIQGVKALAVKAEYLSSILRTYIVERTNSYKLSSNLRTHNWGRGDKM